MEIQILAILVYVQNAGHGDSYLQTTFPSLSMKWYVMMEIRIVYQVSYFTVIFDKRDPKKEQSYFTVTSTCFFL